MTDASDAAGGRPPPDLYTAIIRALAAASDRPNSAPDTDRATREQAGMVRDLRASAWQHLDEGDLAQASNEAWELVVATVRAIGAHHGHIIYTHRGVARVLYELAKLPGSNGDAATQSWINNSFAIARQLRANSYDNRADADEVRAGLERCEELSARMYELFWPEGAAV